jgi:putative Holliday junction resolvase
MSRILAVDFGNRRIGLALSDPLKIIATPLETLSISSLEDGVRQILDCCREHSPETLVIGYPIGTSGRKTEQTLIVDKLIAMLEAELDIPLIPWDERYTSVEAKDILRMQGINTRNNKGKIDQTAARIMLQEYLDTKVKR